MKEVIKKCLECGHHSAIHWNRSLCADCLANLLSEKVKEDSDSEKLIRRP